MKKYTALIIDLQKSRSYPIEDRNSIQNYIITVIKSLNRVFSKSLAREVDFSAGDEVQGLFLSPQGAYLYLRMFCMLIHPVEIRAGIGVGEWNVKIENASTTAQDGPAYHNARKAIDHVKDTLGYSVLIYSENNNDIFTNAMINTYFALTSNHSEYQNEVMLLLELLYPIDYCQVIDPSKISLITNHLTSKNKQCFDSLYKKSKTRINVDEKKIINLDSYPMDAAIADHTFYISSGKRRGMSTKLSDVINISRQSIEKTLRLANIYEARNSTIVALQFIDKYLMR